MVHNLLSTVKRIRNREHHHLLIWYKMVRFVLNESWYEWNGKNKTLESNTVAEQII